jgi:DNA (cytosine-5)-methyltransferase 1
VIATTGVERTLGTDTVARRVDSRKPPYRVPTMREIASTLPNGWTLVSTFTGAGGSCIGYRLAGFRPVYALEFVRAAAQTYRDNFPDVPVDERDVRDVTGDDIRRATGLERFDVLEGSPPCSSFSLSGKRARGWGETRHYSEERSQRTDDLFDEFVRLLADLRPRVFTAENVAGLTTGKALGYYIRFRDAMIAAGYVVDARVLDAQWLGVPQLRRRLIYMGVRQDEWDRGMRHIWPDPLPYRYSIAEALEGLPEPTVRSFVTGREVVDEDTAPSLEGYSLDKHYNSAVGNHRKRLNMKRNPMTGPVGTIVAIGGTSAGTASIVHPLERRKFTIRELKRLGSYPDDYLLTGTYGQRWERIGRSVPPLMSAAIARCVRAMLEAVENPHHTDSEADAE